MFYSSSLNVVVGLTIHHQPTYDEKQLLFEITCAANDAAPVAYWRSAT